MGEARAFDDVVFLGTARGARRDPYRLALFADRLRPGERPTCVLPILGGTLVATDERLLELRPHLEMHGAWNVREFVGYGVHREIPRASIRAVDRSIVPAAGTGSRGVEDSVTIATAASTETFLVSRGTEAVLTEADVAALRDALLGRTG
jgi:hypothetical protein